MEIAQIRPKTVHMAGSQTTFLTLFGEGLTPQNRWMILKDVVPWDDVEQALAELTPADRSPAGRHPVPVRVALGSLIIKEVLGLTDRETVAQIQENPYLQAFLGYASYSSARPFDPSLMVAFRKRFDADLIDSINRLVVDQFQGRQQVSRPARGADDNDDSHGPASSRSMSDAAHTSATGGSSGSPPPDGTLMLDATCAPADITHPNDLALLNHAREITERVIDRCHLSGPQGAIKPRTYREQARRSFLRMIKRRRSSDAQRRRSKRQQLQYIRRNLKYIDERTASGAWSLDACGRILIERLRTVRVVFEQQWTMHTTRSTTVPNRIYSLAQPHVRAIRRSKPGRRYEWGAKVSASYHDGFAFIERQQWDPYNETVDLATAAEQYRLDHGVYPTRILADRIYRTRANRAWCKERGIRLAGIGPGRPPKDLELRAAIAREARDDEADRQPMEGVFGRAKRRLGLGCIMTKLAGTSEVAIGIVFLVMNLLRIAKILWAYLSSTARCLAVALWTMVIALMPSYGRRTIRLQIRAWNGQYA